jgi:hypothetical protein
MTIRENYFSWIGADIKESNAISRSGSDNMGSSGVSL